MNLYKFFTDLQHATSQLDKKLKELLDANPMYPRKTWSERMEYEEENWKDMRKKILVAMLRSSDVSGNSLCMDCQDSTATLRCIDCGPGPLFRLCYDCDVSRHLDRPFHRREMWINGFYQAVPTGRSVDLDEEGGHNLVSFGKCIKNHLRCQKGLA